MIQTSDDKISIIRKIYEMHAKKMLYTASKILGEARAEDAVHDVFVKLIEKYDENSTYWGDKPAQFFIITVRNHSLNLLRKDKDNLAFVDNDHNDHIFVETSSDMNQLLIESEDYAKLVTLIRHLKSAARQILEYKYICEYSNKEIAEILGISQTAVSTRIWKAKKRLRELMESEGWDYGKDD